MITDILLVLTGIVVGVMNGVAGGGMLIGFPILLATGMPALVANATSNIIVLPGQISSAYGYRSYLRQIPHGYLLLAIPCVIGAGIGATILRNTSPARFEELVPGLIVFAVLLFTFQPCLHFTMRRHINGPKKHRASLRPIIPIAILMLPLAVYGGYFGVGFGFIMLALLGFSKLKELHQMNALKNLMAVAIATTSLIFLSGAHLIDWRHGLFMAFGTGVGGYIGSISAQHYSSHTIRVVVIAIGVTTATYLVFRSY
ncbi:MAG: sulfite exporter TauE/SafE family protein [Candidatus Saccharimonadales bacterium]